MWSSKVVGSLGGLIGGYCVLSWLAGGFLRGAFALGVHSCLECALSQCREGEGPWIFSLTAVCAEAHSM